MDIQALIRSLEEQAQDKESLIPPDEPDSIFAQDAQALWEAAGLLQRLESLPGEKLPPWTACVFCGRHYPGEYNSSPCWSSYQCHCVKETEGEKC